MYQMIFAFPTEADAISALSAYGEQGPDGWAWALDRVIPNQRAVTAREVWDHSNPENPTLVSPEQTLPGYWITALASSVVPPLRDLPACRVILDQSGSAVYSAPDLPAGFLAGTIIEPGAALGPPPPAPTVAELQAYAADVRWRKETGGTVVASIPIPTDDRAKVLLMGAALGMADEDTAPYVVGATSVTLTGAQFKALYAGLIAHVQSCFDTQTTVLAGIAAGTITTRAQIDEAFA